MIKEAQANFLSKLMDNGGGYMLARALPGAAVGAYVGHEVTPTALGYDDNEAATGLSTLLDGLIGGAAAGMGRKGWSQFGKQLAKDPKEILGVTAALGASEIMPVGLDSVTTATNAAQGLNTSIKSVGDSIQNAGVDMADATANTKSMNEQLSDILTSDAAKGVGAGAGVAGLGAILTGLMRSKTDSEMKDDTSRLGMVANDFATYVLPAAIAGGVLNHYRD